MITSRGNEHMLCFEAKVIQVVPHMDAHVGSSLIAAKNAPTSMKSRIWPHAHMVMLSAVAVPVKLYWRRCF
jgi:hypothetical protein